MSAMLWWCKQDDWVAELVAAMPPRRQPDPGRDCPACPCPRDWHGGWGCSCGCAMPIALITARRYA